MAFILQRSRLLGLIIGVGLGAVLVFLASARAEILIGVVLGTTAGCLAGLLPSEMVQHSIRLSLCWSKTARLKERLVREHGLAHLIIAELLRRGEPVGQFRDCVQSLLRSDSGSRRKVGQRIQRRWLPELPS